MRCTRHKTRRRGMAMLVVLAIVSIALSVSFALLHTQSMTLQVQTNVGRTTSARHAALAGLSIGLRKMHRNSWLGVDQPLAGSLSDRETYTVTYVTGDAQLTSTSPNFAQFPYRVTVTSTGYVTDPSNPAVSSSHRVEAVVQLVPRALSPPPSTWSQMLQYTVYQTDTDQFTMQLPSRIEGPVRLQGTLSIGSGYSWNSSALGQYLGDLNLMRLDGRPDYRPLNGIVNLPFSRTTSATHIMLTAQLGLTRNNIAETARSTYSQPDALSSYQIYAGGKLYNVPQLSGTISGSYVPDPQTNPLGLYFAPSTVTLSNSATIRGTLIGRQDVQINGQGVRLESFDLPNIAGGTGPLRLPAVSAKESFLVNAGGGGSVGGTIIARDEFEIIRGSASAAFAVVGRVIADEFVIDERTEWDLSGGLWNTIYTLFVAQLADVLGNPVGYFPDWLTLSGLNPQPLLTIKRDASSLSEHWQDITQPLYVPAAADGGLHWDLVRWNDSP